MLTVFLTLCILTPYLLYVFLARYLALSDRRRKSPIVHANELASALLLGTALYHVAGYDETFDLFIFPVTTHLAVVGYALLSEWDALHYSLPQARTWPLAMRVTVGTACFVVLGFAILHVHYAIALWGPRIALGGYLATFLILPALAGLLCFALVRNERDSGIVGDVELQVSTTARALLERRGSRPAAAASLEQGTLPRTQPTQKLKTKKQRKKPHGVDAADEEQAAMLPNGEHQDAEDSFDEALDALDGLDESGDLRTVPPIPESQQLGLHDVTLSSSRPGSSPAMAETPATLGLGRTKLRIHLHHYQIFAYLALFCRFPTVWSRFAAGLVLGSLVHGLAAYGMDSLFEYVDDIA